MYFMERSKKSKVPGDSGHFLQLSQDNTHLTKKYLVDNQLLFAIGKLVKWLIVPILKTGEPFRFLY